MLRVGGRNCTLGGCWKRRPGPGVPQTQSTAGGPRPVLVLEMGMGLHRMARGCWTGRSAGAVPRILVVPGWIPGREKPSWVAGLGGRGAAWHLEQSQAMACTLPSSLRV